MKQTSRSHPQQREYPFIYIARILASLAVVSLHAVGHIPQSVSATLSINWFVTNAITASSIWAVPVFVMISGSLLLNGEKIPTARTFYRRRFMRVGIPTIFWVFFSYGFYHFYRGDPLTPFAILKYLIFGHSDHLYFLFIILELYLITPFLQSGIREISRKNYLFLVLLFLFIGVFWKLSRFTVTMFIPYIGYYLAGHYLLRFPPPKHLLTYFRITGVLSILVLLGTLFIMHLKHTELYYLTYHANPLIISMSIAVFTILMQGPLMKTLWGKLSQAMIKDISAQTLGIYILHPFILGITLWVFRAFPLIQEYHWPVALLFIPYLYLTSFLATKLLRKIPFGDYLV